MLSRSKNKENLKESQDVLASWLHSMRPDVQLILFRKNNSTTKVHHPTWKSYVRFSMFFLLGTANKTHWHRQHSSGPAHWSKKARRPVTLPNGMIMWLPLAKPESFHGNLRDNVMISLKITVNTQKKVTILRRKLIFQAYVYFQGICDTFSGVCCNIGLISCKKDQKGWSFYGRNTLRFPWFWGKLCCQHLSTTCYLPFTSEPISKPWADKGPEGLPIAARTRWPLASPYVSLTSFKLHLE